MGELVVRRWSIHPHLMRTTYWLIYYKQHCIDIESDCLPAIYLR